jgi:exosortase/archaeosortase family protein
LISLKEKGLVNIAEGCNGIAVFNTLLSFIIAFKSDLSKYLKFIPISLAILFIINIIRLYILVEIKISTPQFFELFHTYIFPIILYFITFILMIVWVKFFNKKEDVSQ